MSVIYLPPRQENKLGQSLGQLFASLYGVGVQKARQGRAQQILEDYERSMSGQPAPEQAPEQDQGGILRSLTAPIRALSPSNFAEWQMGPYPDVKDAGSAMAALSQTGIGQRDFATFAQSIQDTRRKHSMRSLQGFLEKSVPGVDWSGVMDGSQEDIALTLDALRLSSRGAQGGKVSDIYINDPNTGEVRRVKALINPNTGSFQQVGDTAPLYKPGEEGPSFHISYDPDTKRMDVGFGPAGKAAQAAAGSGRGRRQASLETARTDLETFGQHVKDLDELISRQEFTPGGGVGKVGAWLDNIIEPLGTLAGRMGVPVPSAVDIFGEDLAGEMGGLTSEQQAALLPLATVYARLNDPTDPNPSREELKAAIEAVKPIVLAGSPQQGRIALRKIYGDVLMRTNALLEADGMDPVEGVTDLLSTPTSEVTEEEIERARREGRVIKWGEQ